VSRRDLVVRAWIALVVTAVFGLAAWELRTPWKADGGEPAIAARAAGWRAPAGVAVAGAASREAGAVPTLTR
jgi:hypothetical protein